MLIKNGRFKGLYKSSLEVLVAPVSIAPFFIVAGDAETLVKIRKLKISGATLTAVEYLNVALTKYSSLPTGGTPVVATKVPVSSAYSTSAADLVQGYTAAPTAGTPVGDIANIRFLGQATVAAASAHTTEVIFDFTDEPIVLVNALENIGLRFDTAPASAVTLNVEVEWFEESMV